MNDKLKLKRDKLAFRESVGRGLPQKEKKKATGEFELFKKIALERSYNGTVRLLHIDKKGKRVINSYH